MLHLVLNDVSSPTQSPIGTDGPNEVPSSTPSVYTNQWGQVFYATDCPKADPLLMATADGLPLRGATDHAEVLSTVERINSGQTNPLLLGEASTPRARVIPRNGGVWERDPEGRINIVEVHDYMIELPIASAEQCPEGPTMFNGIPIAYRVSESN